VPRFCKNVRSLSTSAWNSDRNAGSFGFAFLNPGSTANLPPWFEALTHPMMSSRHSRGIA
jgi:hypothetical protein